MSDAAGRTVFYPAWISNHAGKRPSLCWGKPCDTPAEAGRLGKAELDAGNCTLAFVVRFEGGRKEPVLSYVQPKSARRVVEHWLELLAACEDEEGEG